MEYISKHKKMCLHPFNAFPFKHFESGGVGRQTTLKLCYRLIDICDEFWVFGISEGTLIEADYFFKKNRKSQISKPIKVLVQKFDPAWQDQRCPTKFKSTLNKLIDFIQFS